MQSARRVLPLTPFDVYEISDFISRFKFYKSQKFYHLSRNPEEDFIILPQAKMKKMLRKVEHLPGLAPYDFLVRKTIEQYL